MGRPGDRFRRWRTSYSISAGIFFAFAAFIAFGVDGYGKLIALFPLSMAILDVIDAKRGWRIRDDIPLHAKRMARRPGRQGRYARDAIEALRRESDEPPADSGGEG